MGAIRLTPKEIREDAELIAREEFNMKIGEFIGAVQSGKLDRYDKRVRELLLWVKALPEGKNLIGQANE
jgi:hypothetical protein